MPRYSCLSWGYFTCHLGIHSGGSILGFCFIYFFGFLFRIYSPVYLRGKGGLVYFFFFTYYFFFFFSGYLLFWGWRFLLFAVTVPVTLLFSGNGLGISRGGGYYLKRRSAWALFYRSFFYFIFISSLCSFFFMLY